MSSFTELVEEKRQGQEQANKPGNAVEKMPEDQNDPKQRVGKMLREQTGIPIISWDFKPQPPVGKIIGAVDSKADEKGQRSALFTHGGEVRFRPKDEKDDYSMGKFQETFDPAQNRRRMIGISAHETLGKTTKERTGDDFMKAFRHRVVPGRGGKITDSSDLPQPSQTKSKTSV